VLELTETLKACLWQTAKTLKGTQRRRFMAQIVQELGTGGQRQAQTELGWCRDTIRKGQRELETGLSLYRCLQGQRPKTSGKQVASASVKTSKPSWIVLRQTDPSFKSTRLYTRVSAAKVRQQLVEQKHYQEAELPSNETIRQRLNQLGYHPAKVAKTQPQKKFPGVAELGYDEVVFRASKITHI